MALGVTVTAPYVEAEVEHHLEVRLLQRREVCACGAHIVVRDSSSDGLIASIYAQHVRGMRHQAWRAERGW